MYPDFSRSRLQGLIDAGFVKVNGEVAIKASAKVDEGDAIEVTFPPPVPAEPEPEDIPLDIIFEDDDILVINKPAGLVVHPAPGHNSGTLVNAILYHCPNMDGIGGVARPGIIHRLDQDTSGVMVIAKSQIAMTSLSRDFATHTNLKKIYLAIVHNRPVPAEGRIENLMARHSSNRKKMAIVTENGKVAITDYRTLKVAPKPMNHNVWEPGAEISLVECSILTGRTHQIRVHMKSLNCPIVGDEIYGRKCADRTIFPPPERQMLHARRLELIHPTTNEPLVFEAPLPDCFLSYIPDALK